MIKTQKGPKEKLGKPDNAEMDAMQNILDRTKQTVKNYVMPVQPTVITLTQTHSLRKVSRTFRFGFRFVAFVHRVERVTGANFARILDAGDCVANL